MESKTACDESGRRQACFVLIDPVRGFTDQRCTYAEAHGLDEMQPIREAVHRIAVFVSQLENDVPAAWIRPIYRPGQFEPQGPMADICLTGTADLDFDPLLTPTGSGVVLDKHDMDAMQSPAFKSWIRSMKLEGLRSVTIGGFLLTSCVRQTAVSLAHWADGAAVEVPLDLTASRQSKYRNFGSQSAVGDAIAELNLAGVDTPKESCFLRSQPKP